MKRFFLPAVLLVSVVLLIGLTVFARSGVEGAASGSNEPCRSAEDTATMNSPNQRKQGTVSYELLASILAKYPERYSAMLGDAFPGPPAGELVVVFAVTEPDGFGGRKINNPAGQAAFNHLHSVEGLAISEYGLITVPWKEIRKNGLPQLPAESTSATLICKPVPAES